MRAALYARVSSKAQAEEDKVSIGEQFSEMGKYSETHGYDVVQRYQDVGSGSTKRRPDFQRMLADAREGLFDVIVCWKSDRLSRGIYPAAALMEVVEARQIRLESVMDSLDMKTFGIYAAVGKIEVDNFRERATLGKRGVAKRGRMAVGSIAYGYRIGEDGRPEIDPQEGPVVKRIFDEYVNHGHGIPTIVRELSEEAVSLRKGSKYKEWSYSQVHRIVTRGTYKGAAWYGRERHVTTEYGRKHFSQPESTWISLPYPKLIDEETWERAQVLREERKSLSKRNTKSFYLLQHLLVCSECGLGFTARTNNGNTVRKNGKTYSYEYDKPMRYYKCRGMEVHHTRCREHPFIKADAIEELVWSQVVRVLKAPELILMGLEAQVEGNSSETLAKDVTHAGKELQNIQAEEDRAIRLHISGKITEEQLDRQRRFITERLERAQAQLVSLRSQQRAVQQRQSLAGGVMAWAKDLQAGLDALTPEERQEVLRLVLSGVSMDGECNVRITLAIPAPEFMSIGSQATSCWSAQ